MRFLLDHDVYVVTARFLSGMGHDVVTVSSVGLARADDSVLLQRAQQEERILVSRDRDFGGLVFVRGAGTGVIYLRMLPSTVDAVHAELVVVLRSHAEPDLRKAFVVVEPGRHRFRKLTGG